MLSPASQAEATTSLNLSRSPKRATGFGVRMLAVAYHLHTIDEYVLDANRILVRFFERRPVSDSGGIEHHHVSRHSGSQKTSAIKTQVRRGQSRQTPDSLGERDHLLLPHVLSQEARKVSVRARVG